MATSQTTIESSVQTATDGHDYDAALKSYYESHESQLVYEVVLGGTQHFGYYDHDTYWPFPLTRGLRRMEAELLKLLNVQVGSRLLDAGCGVGHVARSMAKAGMNVLAIDVLHLHVEKARQVASDAKLRASQMTAKQMDFHDLAAVPSGSQDGVYTMQAFGHAKDAKKVLSEFHRVLNPGGRIALVEVESLIHADKTSADRRMTRWLDLTTMWTALPQNAVSRKGYFKQLLEEAGFVDVHEYDWSDNIRPIVRLFYALVFFPFLIVRLMGLEERFVNMVAATAGHLSLGSRWRFVALSATKSGHRAELAKTR